MASAQNGRLDEAQRRIGEVRRRFIDGLDSRLESLATLALKAAGDAVDASAARDELRLGLHNLAGAAPTLGLDQLGRRASEIERLVIDGRRSSGGLAPEVATAVSEFIGMLRDAVGT